MRVYVTFDRFDALQREAHEKFRRALSDGALETQAEAQRLAPVDTGRLRASISTRETSEASTSFEVYTDVEYSPYVEGGTRYMAPQPFMRPSYERNRLPIVDKCKKALEVL